MDFGWLIPILLVVMILSLLLSFLAMLGLNPAAIIFAVRATRRVRTEQEPRDHYDRWVHGHRRSSRDSKPRILRYLWTSGDEDVPRRYIGRVVGAEPWGTYYILFVRTRRFTWSIPHIVDQALCSDLNRRNLWVKAKGFSSHGPIRIPINLVGDEDVVEEHVLAHHNGFRSSFWAQVLTDIMEDSAWDIGNGMQPPMGDRTRAAQVQQPALTDREFMSEEAATGGRA